MIWEVHIAEALVEHMAKMSAFAARCVHLELFSTSYHLQFFSVIICLSQHSSNLDGSYWVIKVVLLIVWTVMTIDSAENIQIHPTIQNISKWNLYEDDIDKSFYHLSKFYNSDYNSDDLLNL